MSMQTDCVYGDGFIVYASDEQLKQFIKKHSKTISTLERGRELLDYTERCSLDEFNPKEAFYDWANELTSDEGVYGLVADVMFKETGITFEYHVGQEDQDDAILFPEQYPWMMNDREKMLTQDKIECICKEYISDLGGQLKADFIRLEYFG